MMAEAHQVHQRDDRDDLLSLHSILKERLNLSFKRTHSSLMEKNYLQTHGTVMGTKVAVPFANIFMAEVETEILYQSALKPLVWIRYIDDFKKNTTLLSFTNMFRQ